MLRDRYESDAEFWALIEKLTIEMEAELAAIDKLLDDDELYKLIQHDFGQRYPKTLKTGRYSSPVEVLLRMLTVKRLYSWTYRETEWHVRDSLVMRLFCRIYWEAVPDYSTVDKWALTLRPETLHAFNERVTELAKQLKVTRGRKLRTDGTVVETNIHYPTDSSLLADGVRILSRTLKQAQAVLGNPAEPAKQLFRDRSRSAKQQAQRIANAARRRSAAAKAEMKTAYERLVIVTRATVRQAQTVVATLKPETSQAVQRLVERLETALPHVEQTIDQTVRRVFQNEVVPATEKIVSLFEAHTDIIRRKKPGKETEFGHKVWLDEVDGGIVTRWRVLDGNPDETEQWIPAIDYHIAQFGHPPWQASADRGLYSAKNEAYAANHGVKRVILPQPGRKSNARRQHEQQPWFKRGRHFHAGVEGRISVLKNKHQLARCLDHGADGFDKWVGWGVVANNLTHIAATIAL
ncbi:MAG: ISNCY family transposase [Caldilineaceae bacterium]|nr:ISNCY family transposase [Caldilineaceae bacterium]